MTIWFLLGGLLIAATTAAAYGVYLVPARFETLWESPGSRLVSAYAGRYLVFANNGVSLWDNAGKVRDAGKSEADALLGGDAIVFIESGRLTSRDLSTTGGSSGTWTVSASLGEKLLAQLDGRLIFTARPAEGLKYGESWLLRATGNGGAALWEQSVPGIPLILASSDDRIAAGIVDVSSGGFPALAIFDAKTGRAAWTKGLQLGLWRGLGFSADGTVVAALDTGAWAFRPDGSLAWTWDWASQIIAAAVTADATFLSTTGPPGLSKLFSPYLMRALSATGTVLWTRPLRERPLSLCFWETKPVQSDKPEAVVALSAAHVIGFSMKDGERLFAKRTGSRPVSLRGDRLLLESGEGLRLVKLVPLEVSGKALTP